MARRRPPPKRGRVGCEERGCAVTPDSSLVALVRRGAPSPRRRDHDLRSPRRRRQRRSVSRSASRQIRTSSSSLDTRRRASSRRTFSGGGSRTSRSIRFIFLAPRAAGGEAGTPDDLARAWREVEELAELQRYPTDWLFRRLLRRARGLVSSGKFDLLLERVTYEPLAFGRLGEREVREVLRNAERKTA